MDSTELVGALSGLTVEIAALRSDVDSLRDELRENHRSLRSDLDASIDRQARDSYEAKKKFNGYIDR